MINKETHLAKGLPGVFLMFEPKLVKHDFRKKNNEKIQMRDKSKIYNEMDINSCSCLATNQDGMEKEVITVKYKKKNIVSNKHIYRIFLSILVCIFMFLNQNNTYAYNWGVILNNDGFDDMGKVSGHRYYTNVSSPTISITVLFSEPQYSPKMAVWSDLGGMDDLKWYDGTGWNTTYNIRLTDHDTRSNQIYFFDVYENGTFLDGFGVYWDTQKPGITASNVTYGSNLTATITDNIKLIRVSINNINIDAI